MKSKLCLLAMCTSMFCLSSNVYGDDNVICPQYGGDAKLLNEDLTLWAKGEKIPGRNPAKGFWTVDRSTILLNRVEKIDTQPGSVRDGSCLYKVESRSGVHDLKLIQVPQ